MARKPRIEYEGACYHVLTRGNQKQKIFRDSADYIRYLKILSDYKNQHPYYLYAYVLMDNHVHLLMETKKIPLSKIMQGINQRYTGYFNKRYDTVGHLFQGRYKSILCDRDTYLISLVKYIHLNPVRAKVVNSQGEYRWSSHNNYIQKLDGKNIVDIDRVLRMFSEDKKKAKGLYRIFINDGVSAKKEDIYSTIDQRILGSERFADKVMEKYDVNIGKVKRKKKYTLNTIAKGVEELYGISLKHLREKGKDRRISLGKKLFTNVAHDYGYTGREIAFFIKKDPAIVTRNIREKNKLKKESIKLESVISKLQ